MVICGAGPNLLPDLCGPKGLAGFPGPDLFDHSALAGRRLLASPSPASGHGFLRKRHAAMTRPGSRYSSPVVSMAQIARAILLAKANATSMRGLRAIIRASHDPSGMDLRPSQFSRDNAPMTKSARLSVWPALDTRPSHSLPPKEC